MASSGYKLVDEPKPGALAKIAVQPLWPLLAVMAGGVWLSWPWFLLNAVAVGSPTRRRELFVVLGGALATLVTLYGIAVAIKLKWIGSIGAPYWLVGLTVVKLTFTYWLYALQQRTFGLYEHFGGTLANGLPIVVLGFLAERRLAEHLPKFWYLLLS